jgi:hypothetical protein
MNAVLAKHRHVKARCVVTYQPCRRLAAGLRKQSLDLDRRKVGAGPSQLFDVNIAGQSVKMPHRSFADATRSRIPLEVQDEEPRDHPVWNP